MKQLFKMKKEVYKPSKWRIERKNTITSNNVNKNLKFFKLNPT